MGCCRHKVMYRETGIGPWACLIEECSVAQGDQYEHGNGIRPEEAHLDGLPEDV